MPTNFEVNGKPVSVTVEARTTLADCLRHHLRLTGTHVGCEHGVCGACTVIVDGYAVRSCLMLTAQAEGSKVVTVEGLSNDEALTPLQASFRRHHALQCGFCTPGMITTAHALLSEEPDCDADRVREVLSGNLCRCTGYISIVEAVLDARSAYQEVMKNAFIGSAIERREDLRFLRGRGEYLDDLLPERLVYAVILRSSVAHGRIVSIDTSAALKMPGVHAVITAKDMPPAPPIVPMRLQPLPEFKPFEQPVIAHDKVRYVGEPMAMVIADSVAIGEDALEAIEVEIESLAAVADWHVAQADKSLLFEGPGTNRSLTFHAVRGDADAAFAKAPYTRRETLRTGRHYGLTMEPRGVMAEWDAAKGRLTVSGAAKVPFFNRRILAKQIGLPEDVDRHDRERRRRRLRRARRVLSGGFPDPVRGAPSQPAGEVDRGPPREPDGDEPRARGRGRRRDRLRARRHHPGAARPCPCRHGRLYAHQRRGRRAQHRAVHDRAVPHRRTSSSTCRCG